MNVDWVQLCALEVAADVINHASGLIKAVFPASSDEYEFAVLNIDGVRSHLEQAICQHRNALQIAVACGAEVGARVVDATDSATAIADRLTRAALERDGQQPRFLGRPI